LVKIKHLAIVRHYSGKTLGAGAKNSSIIACMSTQTPTSAMPTSPMSLMPMSGGAPLTEASPSKAARPGVIQLAIKEKAALYAAYISQFADGGVFIPSNKDYKLGDDVYVLMTLPDDPMRHPVAGKVAWITPPRAAGNRTQGIGVRFPVDDKTKQLKIKIEQILGGHLGSDRPTQTM
jgi:type IV pilus assembly protein PilZ